MMSNSPLLVPDTKQRYLAGDYLKATGGTWHLEDASFKARQIHRMLSRHRLDVRTVCDIGCGAGGVLAHLQDWMPDSMEFIGYDISPAAHQISRAFRKDNLTFILGDAFDSANAFDLVLAIDVVEHVDDYLGFLRRAREKGRYKIFHVPLELHCSAILRDRLTHSWREVGHIHHFTLSTALESLKHTGHKVIDCFLTPAALEGGQMRLRTRLANVPRRLLPASICARLLGGYSLLALTR